MKKYRKLFKNFFLAVLCIGLVSSIMSITTHAATDFYPDVSKLTTDWHYIADGVYSTRSYEGQTTDGVPHNLDLDNYTDETGVIDEDHEWYGYNYPVGNPWFTYTDHGSTALCNNSNDSRLTGYFWDGVGTYDNTLTLEFGVPSFVRDSSYIYDEPRENFHVIQRNTLKVREMDEYTKYQWRLRSDDSYMNLVRERKSDNDTYKYIPHYFNDNEIFVIGFDLKQVGCTAYGFPLFTGYVFVAAPSWSFSDQNHRIPSGVYVLDHDPLTREQLQAELPLDLNDAAVIHGALEENLTTFKNSFTSEYVFRGPQEAWNPGSFVSFKASTIKQANGLTTVTITVNGKRLVYVDTHNFQGGSLFIGSISQPCATYRNIKLSGTVPPYTLYFSNGYKTGMSQTPTTSISSKSISYGNTYGDLATASCLGYKTTASTAANWYYDSTNTITSSDILRQFKDVYVEPHWTPIKYTVKYTAPKPSNASTNVRGTTAQTNATYDTSFNLPGTGYTLTGYHCNSGWLNENNQNVTGPASNLTTIDGATITLHHTWAPNPYKVQFNSTKPSYAVDVTGATSAYTQDFVYDAAQSLTTNQFSYTGATFVGWATTPNGTKSYANEESVTNLTNTKDAVVNLYALWKPAKYSVRYNRNLHDYDRDSTLISGYEFGKSYTALTQSEAEMSRDGYYIAYWTTNADGTGTRYYAGDKDWPAGENSVEAEFKNLTSVGGATVDLYAHWEPIKYVLVYNKNDSIGGTNPAGETSDSYAEIHYYNETFNLAKNNWTRVNELDVPSVFRGWNLLSDLNSTDKSVKYTARWSDAGTFVNGDSNKLCLVRDSSITIYTVWDDAPVVTATDYELPYNDTTGYDSVPNLVNSDSQEGLVLSKTRLEEILLANAVNKHGDREDGELPAGKNFRIEYFYRPSYSTVDHPTCYEVKYTVEDNTGNTYTQSAMLYAGYLVRIDVQ